MLSSPWAHTARAAPPEVASAASRWKHHPVKEVGGASAVMKESRATSLWDGDSEVETQEHEEKINKYQAMLAARLKAKYFSSKGFNGGDVFEEIMFQHGTVQLSRCPFTSSFANPAKFFRDESNSEKNISPSLTADSSAKNNPPTVAAQASVKKNVISLAAENSPSIGKREPFMNTS